MPTAILEPFAPPPLEELNRKRWTRTEIEELINLGWSAKHYELIDGELIDKRMGKNSPHIMAVMWIQEWLIEIFGYWHVHKEDPIIVAPKDDATNEPESDLTVLRVPLQHLGSKPRGDDILFIVEVASTTRRMDLSNKADLYARAGIPDYWVLDIDNHQMVVHREPVAGRYKSVVAYVEHESVSPLAAPQSEFRVAAAFAK